MVLTGLSVLIEERRDLFSGQRVGLISQTSSVLPDLTGIVDGLRRAGMNLAALFGAEHGFAGAAAAGAEIGNAVDARTGLPVYSLYGPVKAPTAEMLAGLDALVLDFQDAGVRFYTFLSTLYYTLESAGKYGIPLFVLDRPNPINGMTMEGPLVRPGFESFVGIVPVPMRHGMTLGELAWMMNSEHRLNAPLSVIPMRGWQRGMWFDQTGLPWVLPSPAMPHLSTATLYPGMCLLEGVNLSEGRGTALPFEVAGAPWLDGDALADRLNGLGLPGVHFRPYNFKPTASKHAGEVCSGVQVHVLDRADFQAVRTGLEVIAACKALGQGQLTFLPPYEDGQSSHFDHLAGSDQIRAYLEANRSVGGLVETWAAEIDSFAERRLPYLLY